MMSMIERKIMEVIDEEKAKTILESGYDQANEILNDNDKFERFLQRLEKKLEIVPIVGDKLADIPIMISLLKSFKNGEYTDAPIGTIIAILSALIYFVSPFDIIPDSIPFLGHLDDVGVVSTCWKMVDSDVEEYRRWREANGKIAKDL